jgi:hypothetical protein
MIRPQIPQQFPLQTVSTSRFLWLAEEAWEEPQIRFVAAVASHCNGSNFWRFFEGKSVRNYPRPRMLGRWILVGSDTRDAPELLAELWSEPGRFGKLDVFFKDAGAFPKFDAEKLSQSLSFILSAFLIAGKADVLSIAATDVIQSSFDWLKGNDEVAWQRRVWSPVENLEYLGATAKTFHQHVVFDADAMQWWDNPVNALVKKDLHYLEVRALPKPSFNRPRVRGIAALGRLFSGNRRRLKKKKANLFWGRPRSTKEEK